MRSVWHLPTTCSARRKTGSGPMTEDNAQNAVLDAIRRRRVTRSMGAEPVDPDALAQVVDATRYAPNAGNRRLQPVIAVTDDRVLRLIRMVSPGMIVRPRAALVICLDTARARAYGFREGTPGLYVDVGTAAATALLAAYAVGLGSCPVTSFSKAAVARLLDLDGGLKPQMIICLGHPAGNEPPNIGAPAPSR
jgi:nitroreductase